MNKNIRIVHFLEATLFTEAFIESFSKMSGHVDFYILNDGSLDKGYLKKPNVYLFDTNNSDSQKTIITNINLSDIKLAVFHLMNGKKMEIILSLKKDIRKIWCLWGNDLYDSNYFYPFKLYEKHNLAYAEQDSNFIKKFYHKPEIKTLIFKVLLLCKSLKLKSPFLNKLYVTFTIDKFEFIKNNIDGIGYIVPKEKRLLERFFPDKIYSHLYSDPELPQFKHLSEISGSLSGNNILLAHSAAESNNHLDCIEILRTCKLSDRKIIAPLSYGGSQPYIDEVIRKGKEYFGESFVPITERLPLDAYSKILSTCSVAMMNQRRQQAGGNLFHLIGSGIKVYLNTENGFYDYFNDNGIKVYNIKNFKNTFDYPADLRNNPRKLKELYSEEHFQEQLEILTKKI